MNHADLGCITSVNLQCFRLLELQISTVLVQIWINCLSYLQWFKLQYTVFVSCLSCLHYFQWLRVAPNFNSDCMWSPLFTVTEPGSTLYSDCMSCLHNLQWLNLAPQYKSDCCNFSSQITVIERGSKFQQWLYLFTTIYSD